MYVYIYIAINTVFKILQYSCIRYYPLQLQCRYFRFSTFASYWTGSLFNKPSSSTAHLIFHLAHQLITMPVQQNESVTRPYQVTSKMLYGQPRLQQYFKIRNYSCNNQDHDNSQVCNFHSQQSEIEQSDVYNWSIGGNRCIK